MKLPGLYFQNLSTCYNVVEANNLSGEIMKKAKVNVIDVSFALQAQGIRRNRDGIHWSSASNRLMTHITLTHLTLTLPNCGPHLLPGRMKKSISLTNLIRLKMKRKSKRSSSRRSLETGGFSNSVQQPPVWSPGSLPFSFNAYNYQPYPPQYYGTPQVWFWPTPVQHQQRPFTRRDRGAPRYRDRYHPYYPHYY